MEPTQIQKTLEMYKDSVNFVLERDDLQFGHKLYRLVQKIVKSEQTIPDELLHEYKILASRLRAHIYRRFPTRDIPKIFKNDIAHALHKPSYEVIKGVSIFLDRFKIGDDFSRQQRNIVNNLLDNKQRLTENSIIVDDNKKVAPTVGNWIKYFYRKVGGQQTTNRIKIAEFFSKDSNILKLSKAELHKVKNLIQMQEYLRRPTDELRKELLEIMISIGDGKIAVFENGDFSILFGIEEQKFVRDYFKKSDVDVDTNGLSEVEALVKQTKAQRPKRTELKPVSSAMPETLISEDQQSENKSATDLVVKPEEKQVDNKTELVQKEGEEKKITKDTNLVDDLISDVLSQASARTTQKIEKKSERVKQEDKKQEGLPQKGGNTTANNKEGVIDDAQKQQKKKNAQEIVQQLLKNSVEDEAAIEKAKNSINVETISKHVNDYLNAPQKHFAIALLHVIAEHNLWDQVSSDPALEKFVKEFDTSTTDQKIAAVIHTFLEKHDIMNATESARIAAQLTNYIHKSPEYKDIHLVYFDMTSESFHWYVNL